MKNILIAGALCLATGAANAALDDYQLRRLPISLGKQFEDANGNQRVILPSYISNSGIMGGSRLTWERPVDELGNPLPGVTRLVNQSGYLYDLNTRTYIAQHIAGQSVSYVGDDFYISKRLHPSVRRWQTYRCAIEGLVQRPDSNLYDNSSCVLIDNDWLNQTPPHGTVESYWASQFITITMLSVSGFGYSGTNAASSSVVWDIDDNYPVYETDQANLYRANGQKIALDDAFISSTGVPVSSEGDIVKVFGMSEGKDTFWGGVNSADGAAPASVYQVQLQDDGTSQTTQIVINQILADGSYADVLMVSKSGLILTESGTCSFASGCTDGVTFVSPLAATNMSPLFLGDGLLIGGSASAGGSQILDLRTDTPEGLDVVAAVQEKFGETLVSSGSFVFPQTTTNNGSLSANISVSESGDHIVIAVKTVENGYRMYYFEKQ
ncbi:MAG: hypothetical protein KBT87_01355 [Gammaproteobacteria bacterium]|nr:hypothetical protein [Gammaproteobacteria bacterium]MBQ0773299.1 hypothetical protein [Gammaproteobacteria bacterium]